MPRERKKAPNATVGTKRGQDQRRATELEYDRRFPDKKHMWKDPNQMGSLVKSGLLEVVKDDDDKEISNRMSVLCAMPREKWEATMKAGAEGSYEEAKSYRGNFEERDLPLRQFQNFKAPRGKDE